MPAGQRQPATFGHPGDRRHRGVHLLDPPQLVTGPQAPLLGQYPGQRLPQGLGLARRDLGEAQPFVHVVRLGEQHLAGPDGIQQGLPVGVGTRVVASTGQRQRFLGQWSGPLGPAGLGHDRRELGQQPRTDGRRLVQRECPLAQAAHDPRGLGERDPADHKRRRCHQPGVISDCRRLLAVAQRLDQVARQVVRPAQLDQRGSQLAGSGTGQARRGRRGSQVGHRVVEGEHPTCLGGGDPRPPGRRRLRGPVVPSDPVPVRGDVRREPHRRLVRPLARARVLGRPDAGAGLELEGDPAVHSTRVEPGRTEPPFPGPDRTSRSHHGHPLRGDPPARLGIYPVRLRDNKHVELDSELLRRACRRLIEEPNVRAAVDLVYLAEANYHQVEESEHTYELVRRVKERYQAELTGIGGLQAQQRNLIEPLVKLTEGLGAMFAEVPIEFVLHVSTHCCASTWTSPASPQVRRVWPRCSATSGPCPTGRSSTSTSRCDPPGPRPGRFGGRPGRGRAAPIWSAAEILSVASTGAKSRAFPVEATS
ncbi:hypothetical protein FAIPA1_180042 [Frankia sp. AiPs1]